MGTNNTESSRPMSTPVPAPPYTFDPTDVKQSTTGRAFHLTLDATVYIRESDVENFLNELDDVALYGRILRCHANNGIQMPFSTGSLAQGTSPMAGVFTHGIIPESKDPVTVTCSPHVEPLRYTRS